MRFPVLLSLTLGAAAVLVLSAYASFALVREEQELRNNLERDLRVLGSAVRVALENALRDGQEIDVAETLDSLERTDHTVDILVFSPELVLNVSSADELPTDIDAKRRLLGEVVEDGEPRTVFDEKARVAWRYVPLRHENGVRLGGVVIGQPLTDLYLDIARTRRAMALSVALVFTVIVGAGYLIGRRYVSRPVLEMAQAMRRVRMGDLSFELGPQPLRELRKVGREFNAMLTELRDARQRIREETETRRLLETNLQRADKLATLGELASSLAHEIGSPLQVIHGRARTLAQSGDSSLVQRNGAIIAEQAERVSRIVQQLLRLARRRPREHALVKPVEVTRTVINFVEFLARKNDVRLTMDAAPDTPDIIADGDQLQQVLLNLLTNAMRASAKGGEVLIRLDAVDFRRPANAVNERGLRIRVTDTGQGMSESELAQAFTAFFTTSDGTGLGLAVVKSIVDEHSGLVRAASTPGKGTVVEVILPINARYQEATS